VSRSRHLTVESFPDSLTSLVPRAPHSVLTGAVSLSRRLDRGFRNETSIGTEINPGAEGRIAPSRVVVDRRTNGLTTPAGGEPMSDLKALARGWYEG
jgi:hypothetical protein